MASVHSGRVVCIRKPESATWRDSKQSLKKDSPRHYCSGRQHPAPGLRKCYGSALLKLDFLELRQQAAESSLSRARVPGGMATGHF